MVAKGVVGGRMGKIDECIKGTFTMMHTDNI